MVVVSVTVATTVAVDFALRIFREVVAEAVVAVAKEVEAEAAVEEEEERKRRKSHPLIWMHKWKRIWPLVPKRGGTMGTIKQTVRQV